MWGVKVFAVIVVAAVVVIGMERSEGHWTLATDVQKYYRCLPFDWYVVTAARPEETPKRGELVRFTPPKDVERFTEAFEIIKIVVAVEGDRWRIEQDQLFINDKLWGDLHLITSINAAPGSLDGEGVVPAGHVYVLGTNPSSYDSRYWGPLANHHITGKAHVVF